MNTVFLILVSNFKIFRLNSHSLLLLSLFQQLYSKPIPRNFQQIAQRQTAVTAIHNNDDYSTLYRGTTF